MDPHYSRLLGLHRVQQLEFECDVTAGSSSWTAASDERLKDVTGTYMNALEDPKQIKPIKFTWKQHPENGPQVGVIAQSVVDVVPEA